MEKNKWKKVIELIVVILTAIGSFIGGNAAAKNGYKVINNQNQIELCQQK